MYRSDDEIGDKIKYFLEHEEERELIAAKLLSIVKEHHTWESRCKTILMAVGAV
jgi:spore maturation protein CgeB